MRIVSGEMIRLLQVTRWGRSIALLGCFISGMLYAAALPPLNWFPAAFVTLVWLLLCCSWYGKFFRAFCGWVWGLGWSLFAYRFLREINPLLPFLLAPVISLFPALFALIAGWLYRLVIRHESFSGCDSFKVGIFVFATGAAWILTEFLRYRLFVWNDFSVTMWKVPQMMQIAYYTGRYGVNFLVALLNGAFFALFFRRGKIVAAGVGVLALAVFFFGCWRMTRHLPTEDTVTLKCALVQGNLPQQRLASEQEILDSLQIYTALSRRVIQEKPDLLLWPECAIPIPLRGNSYLSDIYRKNIAPLIGTPLLIGTLDFTNDNQMTNSALLIDRQGVLRGKYDKFHRVPFGEYVPFRNFLPQWMIRYFDMGRDLAAGDVMEPLKISPDIRIGTAICYEGVFSYLACGFARNGANVLSALSNDVWYPSSSEPEQHLANAVMRCVETGLPMIRCGNNGGSGVVDRFGVFTQYIGSKNVPHPELLREQSAGVVTVTFERYPELSPAVRMENSFVYLVLLTLFAVIVLFFYRNGMGKTCKTSGE